MGSEFNGKKFDVWQAYECGYSVYGVWNNDMKAKQYIEDWEGIIAPDYEAAKRKARENNKAYEKLKNHTH